MYHAITESNVNQQDSQLTLNSGTSAHRYNC